VALEIHGLKRSLHNGEPIDGYSPVPLVLSVLVLSVLVLSVRRSLCKQRRKTHETRGDERCKQLHGLAASHDFPILSNSSRRTGIFALLLVTVLLTIVYDAREKTFEKLNEILAESLTLPGSRDASSQWRTPSSTSETGG